MAAAPRTSDHSSQASCCSSGGHAAPAGADHHGHPGHAHAGHEGRIEEGARDPVCGMTVDPHTAKYRHQHEGRPYYFCSAGCLAKFKADPAKYLDGSAKSAPVPEGTIYTCPMHPQVRQVGPGACPICGS